MKEIIKTFYNLFFYGIFKIGEQYEYSRFMEYKRYY